MQEPQVLVTSAVVPQSSVSWRSVLNHRESLFVVVGALLVIIGFFLPWVFAAPDAHIISGYTLATDALHTGAPVQASDIYGLVFMVFPVVLAVFTLICGIISYLIPLSNWLRMMSLSAIGAINVLIVASNLKFFLNAFGDGSVLSFGPLVMYGGCFLLLAGGILTIMKGTRLTTPAELPSSTVRFDQPRLLLGTLIGAPSAIVAMVSFFLPWYSKNATNFTVQEAAAGLNLSGWDLFIAQGPTFDHSQPFSPSIAAFAQVIYGSLPLLVLLVVALVSTGMAFLVKNNPLLTGCFVAAVVIGSLSAFLFSSSDNADLFLNYGRIPLFIAFIGLDMAALMMLQQTNVRISTRRISVGSMMTMVGSILALLGFFIPWANVAFSDRQTNDTVSTAVVSGWTIATNQFSFANLAGFVSTALPFFLALAGIIMSGISFVRGTRTWTNMLKVTFAGALPLLLFKAIQNVVVLTQLGTYYTITEDGFGLSLLWIGGFVWLAGAITNLYARNEIQTNPSLTQLMRSSRIAMGLGILGTLMVGIGFFLPWLLPIDTTQTTTSGSVINITVFSQPQLNGWLLLITQYGNSTSFDANMMPTGLNSVAPILLGSVTLLVAVVGIVLALFSIFGHHNLTSDVFFTCAALMGFLFIFLLIPTIHTFTGQGFGGFVIEIGMLFWLISAFVALRMEPKAVNEP